MDPDSTNTDELPSQRWISQAAAGERQILELGHQKICDCSEVGHCSKISDSAFGLMLQNLIIHTAVGLAREPLSQCSTLMPGYLTHLSKVQRGKLTRTTFSNHFLRVPCVDGCALPQHMHICGDFQGNCRDLLGQ